MIGSTMYVKVIGQAVERYPYSIDDLRRDNPQTSFPKNPSEELLASWGVLPVVSTDAQYDPATQVATQAGCTFNTELNRWETAWAVRDKTADELQADKQALIAKFDRALSEHLDATAQQRRYDNRITCAVRAGFAGPFQQEAIAFAQWMDSCNQQAYQMLAEIEAGTRPMFADTAEFIAALPVMVWPS